MNTPEIIYFWRPHESNGWLGNWYPSEFISDGKRFINSEHYFMWRKVMMFEPGLEQVILGVDDPKKMKDIGQSVKNYDDGVWSAARYDVMKTALYEKFTQNPLLLAKLLGTGSALLVEASPYDRIWGIGLDMAAASKGGLELWRGQNLLGKALMETRARLR